MDYSFRIRVQPGASKNEIVHTEDGIKVRLQAPAVEGKANKACVRFLSKALKIPKSRIEITRGQRARDKEITIYETSEAEAARVKAILRLA